MILFFKINKMKLNFLNIKNFTCLILLLIFFNSCKYANHHTNMQPSHKLEENKKINIALVLSGAGSKGIAHTGVIAAFEKHNIPIDLIVGSSAGSLVGLLYADSKNIAKVKEILVNASRKDFLQGSPAINFIGATLFNTPSGFKQFDKFLTTNIKATNFEELQIPLAVVTIDINSSKSHIFNYGDIKSAIFASCAIPGLYQPVKIGDKLLIDGGVISPVPVKEALQFKPNVTVAVNIVSPPPSDEITNNLSILYRSSWITYYSLSLEQESYADISVNIDTSKYDWLDDLSKKDKIELFELGLSAGEKLIINNPNCI